MSKLFTNSFTLLTLLVIASVVTASENHWCDIRGLDEVVVVRALWRGSHPAPVVIMNDQKLAALTDIPDAEIYKALSDNGRIGYLCGRALKVTIRDGNVFTRKYNDYHGDGAVERIIDALKSQQNR